MPTFGLMMVPSSGRPCTSASLRVPAMPWRGIVELRAVVRRQRQRHQLEAGRLAEIVEVARNRRGERREVGADIADRERHRDQRAAIRSARALAAPAMRCAGSAPRPVQAPRSARPSRGCARADRRSRPARAGTFRSTARPPAHRRRARDRAAFRADRLRSGDRSIAASQLATDRETAAPDPCRPSRSRRCGSGRTSCPSALDLGKLDHGAGVIFGVEIDEAPARADLAAHARA